MSILEATQLLRDGALSAEQLIEAHLARIESTEPSINAFITVTAERARAAARAADAVASRGDSLGPLHGIPVALKDNIDTAGVRTTSGSSFLADNVPTQDATVVQRLTAAGAIVVGKTNMHEFAWGATTENEHYGPTRNPWDLSRNAHGSSGGSAAAVAAGQCLVGLGSDTGGSIRNPAAVTGLTGLRPTVGRVSGAGVFPLAWSMDTVGPIARSAADVALVHSVIAGHDPADPATSPRPVPPPPSAATLEGKRIGIVRDFALQHVDDGVRAAVEQSLLDLQEAGAMIVDVDLPDVGEYYSAWFIIQTAEPSSVHRHLLEKHRDEYGSEVRGLLHAGQAIPATDYILAQRHRQLLRRRYLAVLDGLDALVTPTSATIAAPIGSDPRELAKARAAPTGERTVFTSLPSVLAMPALSVPCGFSEGMPVGLQLMGAPFDENGILEIGIGYQQVTDWHRAVAPL